MTKQNKLNCQAADFDPSETLVTIMKHQAERTPDNPFIVYNGRSFTYKEMDDVTDKLAAHIQSLGIEHEETVGVMIGRSELMFVYSMAVMKAGGSYMPLDAHFPEERLMFMCEDAGVRLILADDGLVQRILPKFEGTVFESSQIKDLPPTDKVAFREVKTEDRMVVLYTSGSTGQPKGVELEQHGIVNYCHAYVRLIDMKAEDRIVAYANYGFDVHMMDIYPPMLVGASVYILPDEMRLDLAAMHEYMEENRISVGFMTTTIATQMVSMFPISTLRVFGGGGEKMPAVTPPSNYRFINFYGPTETSIGATSYDVKSYFEGEYIGQPLPGYNLYIVDEEMNPVADGEAGELLIAGTSVARGYLNRPELTAEKFITYHGERAYRSGDLVRWATDPRDGSRQIEFIGRMDGQVKLRGLRIELGEIENRVAAYPKIRQACVTVKEVGGQQNLVCYYTQKDESVSADIASELKAFLSKTLTAFMVPEIYVRLDAIPLSPNGKIDRKALPAPTTTAAEIESVPPATEVEKQLFEITASLLGHDQFGVTHSLIAEGLTSLSAMRLSAMVKIQMGMSLPFAAIMKTPTLRELAYLLTQGQDQLPDEQTARIHEKKEYYPLTENQRGLYIDWEMNHDGLQYNLPDVKVIKGYSAEQLKAAMEKVVAAHPLLKMRLAHIKGEVVMHRRDAQELPVSIQPLSEAPDATFFQGRVRPFNLFKDDLCRIEIYTYEDKVFLFTDIHHIIYDGGSTFAFEGDTRKALQGEELTIETYTAYDRALDEQEMRKMPIYEKAERYFEQLMTQGFEVASYPFSSQPKASPMGTLRTKATLPGQTIKEFCRTHAVTESSLFLTATSHTLHRILREEDLMLASITNGRVTPEMHDIIGMFVQTLPVISHSADKTVEESVRMMQEQFINTQDHCIVPYTRLVEKYDVRAEILFVYQGGAGTLIEKTGEEACYAVAPHGVMYPICIEVVPSADDYNIFVEYDTSKYSQKDMQLLADAISVLAQRMSADAHTPIRQLPLVSDEEATRLKELGYGGDLKYDTSKTFVDVFMEQCRLHPERTAVVGEDATYTYQELDSRSNAIAQNLIEQGVQAGDFVCISMWGSANFVAAAIGIEKAGAAYVPIDPEYPEERRLYMQQDCESKVVIHEEWLRDYDSGTRQTTINRAKPDGLAYMIYTSGSTGKPKGVMIPHSAKMNFVQFIAKEHQLTENSRICCHPSVSFDASIEDLYPVLTVGGTLYIVPQKARKDMILLHRFIVDNSITGANFSTLFGQMLLQQYPDIPMDYIVVGGEKMTMIPPCKCRLINGYGPTEFTVGATYYEISETTDYRNIPIGRPVTNCYAYIMDYYGQLAPRGVAGELCLAGPQIARGYWKREELTKEKFQDGQMYHTGDLCQWDESGNLLYAGRMDSQVKLRGFRIELGEIESVATQIKGIKQAVAIVRKEQIVLYYTAEAEEAPSENEMKEWLTSHLTDYMVPSVFMKLDKVPMTPNGKVNTKALPDPIFNEIALENVKPATTREKILLQIAHDILGRDDFGVTDGLKHLGLTSLSAMQLVLRAKEKKVHIEVADILQHDTIRRVSQKKMSLGQWYEPYQENKPILVFVSGIVAIHFNAHRFERLARDFNIFVIEPIDEHYAYAFSDGEKIDKVVAQYYDLLATQLPENAAASAFIGFSMAGNVAYEMARTYYQQTGIMSRVVIGDSEYAYRKGGLNFSPKELAEELRAMLMEDETIDKSELDKLVKYEVQMAELRFGIVNTVCSGYEASSLACDVLLFNTLKEDKPKDYVDHWRTLVSSVQVVDIDDKHNAFCLDISRKWLECVCDEITAFCKQ